MTQSRADTCNAGPIPYLKLGAKQGWSIKFNEIAKDWLAQVFIPASRNYIGGLELEIDQYQQEHEYEKAGKTAKRLGAWNTFDSKIKEFCISSSLSDWISFSDNKDSLIVKPLTASLFAQDILLGRAEHVVMMSATILNWRRDGGRALAIASRTGKPSGEISRGAPFPFRVRCRRN